MRDTDPQTTAALLKEVQEAFEGVPHRGVRLHETEVIDGYGTADARRAARKKDTDRRWLEVRDEWIEEFGGVGGLAFLDGQAFRYYLPAYMSYWLRKLEEPNNLSSYLHPARFRELEAQFHPEELRVIARFVDHIQRVDPHASRNREERRVLNEYWRQHLSSGSQS